MPGQRLVRALLAVSIACSTACASLPPDTARETFRIDVTNDYPYPMSVTVRHNGGLVLLGVIPPGASREFQVRLWHAQPVSVVATPLDNFQKLAHTVTVGPNCIARVVLQDVRIGKPVAAPPETDPDSAQARLNHTLAQPDELTRSCPPS
jgi:hypothetical protein